jgi:O-succinylbenzoic acid--CoA ligase
MTAPEGRAGLLHVAGPVAGPVPVAARDVGDVDTQGRVRVYGRADDVIISGGENIAPFEVESVLLSHPDVADAAVVGVADARWGQRPVAVLVPRGAARPDANALAGWCRGRLAAHKVPQRFVWRRALPRDALGKLRRQQLVPLLQQGVDDV